jgi:hypothetical protein
MKGISMIELNSNNGADKRLRVLQKIIVDIFPTVQLVGVEMGIAYGGGVEALAKLWGKRGIVYGFDTFEGHPKELASSPEAHEAICLDTYYEKHGLDKLSYEYQRAELNQQGLDNVVLVKGIIDQDSCWRIPRIHYCLLDLDLLISMQSGYEAVRYRITDGGFLCLHDVVGHDKLPELHAWYENIKKDPMWEVVYEDRCSYLAVLRRVR